MLSEALWGLGAVVGTALAGAMAADVWQSARLRFAGLFGRGEPAADRAAHTPETGTAERDAQDEHRPGPRSQNRPRARPACVQHNIAGNGGTQHITLSGDVNVGRRGWEPR